MDSVDNNPPVSLKEAIDLNDLRAGVSDPQKGGIFFELKENDGLEEDEPTGNTYFDGEELAQNLYTAEEESDEDDDSTPFERLARKMVDVCPDKDKGILKQVLKQGQGAVAPVGAVCRVHFNGYLEYADEPYDSSRLRNEICRFRLGQGEVIEGWDVGVSTMRTGELARFLIMPEYAFGEFGVVPRIPKKATILFEIELLSFVETAGLDDYFCMTMEERRNIPWADVLKLHKSLTEEAKQYYKANLIRKAFPKYKKVKTILEDYHLKNDEEEREQRKLLHKIYNNLALCCIKHGHAGRAIAYCRLAEEIDNTDPRTLYFMGKALHQLAEFHRARTYLMRAQRIKPKDRDINTEIEKLDKDMRNFKLVEKDMYMKMFSKPKGETEEEKATSDRHVKEALDKSMKCSEAFRQMVEEKLIEFKDDKDLMEFPMPSYNLTVGEIECIIDNAEKLGLEAKVKGTGQNSQMKVMKKSPEGLS